MTAEECLEMLREIKDAAFATVDQNGRPQVRIIDVMLAEDRALYFCTSRGKDFYHQLIDKEEAAIVGMNEKYQTVRLNGKIEKLKDQKYWIDRIFEENPSMNEVYPGDSRYILEPFRIRNGEIEFFDLGKTPIQRESFSLGTGRPEKKGFFIEDSCIGCGKCRRNCPQKCIEEGTPYRIRQENCLHCGLCQENCPVHAVFPRRNSQKDGAASADR